MSEQPVGGDLSRLRQLNAAAVLRELRGDQPLTLTELSKRTRLSRASTEDVARDLVMGEVGAAHGGHLGHLSQGRHLDHLRRAPLDLGDLLVQVLARPATARAARHSRAPAI